MAEKSKYEITVERYTLMFMFCASMRYSMGGTISSAQMAKELISDNLSIFETEQISMFLREIQIYEEDRKNGMYRYSECQHEIWMKLKEALIDARIKKYMERYGTVPDSVLEEEWSE